MQINSVSFNNYDLKIQTPFRGVKDKSQNDKTYSLSTKQKIFCCAVGVLSIPLITMAVKGKLNNFFKEYKNEAIHILDEFI